MVDDTEIKSFKRKTKISKLSAVKDPLKQTRHHRVIESIFVSMCNSKLFEDLTVDSNQDWIMNHYTEEQTFKDWSLSYSVVKNSKSTIYIQPIGTFCKEGHRLLEWLQSYCSAFFHGIKVSVLSAVSVSKVGCNVRSNSGTGRCQLRATDIIDFLKKVRMPNAICTVAVTMIDLYPRDSWNFVFGLASLTNGVGVFSFARYNDSFYTAPPIQDSAENYDSVEVTDRLLWRACKVMSHEIGHMFGVKHCVYYNCAMNGSNHLEESDRRTEHLCPICLRKLQEALKFDLADRYSALLKFCKGTEMPLQEFGVYKEWLANALSFLETSNYKKKVAGRPR